MHGPYPLLPLTNCKMPTVQYQIQPHHVRETKKNEMEKWTQCELCFFARLMWSNSVNPNFDSKSLQTLLIVHATVGIYKLFYKLLMKWRCLQLHEYSYFNFRFLGVVGHHEQELPIEKMDVSSSGEIIASISHDNR